MRSLQFDPFGEPLDSAGSFDRVQSDVAKVFTRVGVGIFWTLVVCIVAARVIWFDPDVSKTFGTIVAKSIQGFAQI